MTTKMYLKEAGRESENQSAKQVYKDGHDVWRPTRYRVVIVMSDEVGIIMSNCRIM